MPGGTGAVVQIDDSPLQMQPLAVLAPVTCAAAVVYVDDGKAPAGPELGPQVQRAGGGGGRAAVALGAAISWTSWVGLTLMVQGLW